MLINVDFTIRVNCARFVGKKRSSDLILHGNFIDFFTSSIIISLIQ